MFTKDTKDSKEALEMNLSLSLTPTKSSVHNNIHLNYLSFIIKPNYSRANELNVSCNLDYLDME